MIKVGLTGGIGSGKSTVRKLFQKAGIHCIDADEIARQVVQPNSIGLQQVVQQFGEKVLEQNGELNRLKMRTLIFEQPEAKATLETILHPLIREKIFEEILETEQPYTIIEIPLLVETQADYIDYVIVVDCEPETQIERTLQRKGFTKEQVISIMSQQATRAERLKIADWVINSDAPLAVVEQQVQKLVEDLYALSGHG